MPKPSPEEQDQRMPDGTVLKSNLIRLGFCDQVVRTKEIAEKVTAKTGKSMSRQRVANLMNAIRITPETIKAIAVGLGVKPEELTKRPKHKDT